MHNSAMSSASPSAMPENKEPTCFRVEDLGLHQQERYSSLALRREVGNGLWGARGGLYRDYCKIPYPKP